MILDEDDYLTWDRFVDSINKQLLEKGSLESFRDCVSGLSVNWTGVVERVRRTGPGPTATLKMNRREVHTGGNRPSFLERLTVRIKDSLNEWADIIVGDAIDFQVVFADDSYITPAIGIREYQSGLVAVDLCVMAGHPIC